MRPLRCPATDSTGRVGRTLNPKVGPQYLAFEDYGTLLAFIRKICPTKGGARQVGKNELSLRWLILLAVFGLVAFYTKADSNIRVHLINARTGLPMANRPVRLWTHDAAQRRNDPGFVQALTDSNGVATFHVTDPVPSYLYIHVGMGRRGRNASRMSEMDSSHKTSGNPAYRKKAPVGNFQISQRSFRPLPETYTSLRCVTRGLNV
jgi:hypothetical protein